MKIVRGELLFARSNSANFEVEHNQDSALLIDAQGFIKAKGDFAEVQKLAPTAPVFDHRGHWILPGFLDTHVHFPQMDMMGQMAPSLLPWLETYTFPTEIAFRGQGSMILDAAHQFVDELLANGTTLACVFSSSDYEATDLLFAVFAQRGLRGIIGKTSMDRHAPQELLVPLDRDLQGQNHLLQRWHGHEGRLAVALTPRFAPSCTPEMMRELGRMHVQYPDTFVQTHYAENTAELQWIAELFPKAKDYLDVYESFQLIGSRTILAHGIHVDHSAMKRLADRGTIISHCPSSNLFLGSGLMDWSGLRKQGVPLALGTDIGAGTSFSLWQTMNEAHKVAALRGVPLSSSELFVTSTLKAAESLGMTDLGTLEVGYKADFQVIDPSRRPLLDRRLKNCQSIPELLSAFIHLCDERCLDSVWIQGKKVRG